MPAPPPRGAAHVAERTTRVAFVLPSTGATPTRGAPARSPLSARMRGDGWRALAARVARGPLDVADDLRLAMAQAPDVIVIEASAAARASDLLRSARRTARIVLVADGHLLVADERAAERAAALAIELDARCVAPSAAARNVVVARLARREPTWLALARTTVIHDAIPSGLCAEGPVGGPRPLVTHWAAARDVAPILSAFHAARARRSDLRLRVLVDPRHGASRAVPREPGPGVETVPVHDPLDVARELAASSGLYHPLERWPGSSITAPALANAVGVPAHISARCDAAEAVTDRGELLASDAPEALLTAQLHVAASPEPPRAPISFGVTDVALRWLEEVAAPVQP